MPDDDMGQGHAGVDPHGKSITNKTFKVAADSQAMTDNQAKENALELLKTVLGKSQS